MACNHTIHKHNHHLGWDNSLAPALSVRSGETLAVETIDASGGQLHAGSHLEDLQALDFDKVNPVTGPIHIDGAEPGDAVAVTFLAFHPTGPSKGWGWTANIPGFGLLSDDFLDAALHIWNYDQSLSKPAAFCTMGQVPLKPFVGTIGLALAEPGLHSVVPPRRVGGNLDIRDNGIGTTLYLPVEVAGGMMSLGDTHAPKVTVKFAGLPSKAPWMLKYALILSKMQTCCSHSWRQPVQSRGIGITQDTALRQGSAPTLCTRREMPYAV
jgi:acetamidase/formamidase